METDQSLRVEILKLAGSFLVGVTITAFAWWINNRRRRPDLGVQFQMEGLSSDWIFELVIENRWDTELEVSDVEFHLGGFWRVEQVVPASAVPRFENREQCFYEDQKPPPYYRVTVKGRSVGIVSFDMVMLAMRLNKPIKAVVLVDHLCRREKLRRKPLKALVAIVKSHSVLAGKENSSSTEALQEILKPKGVQSPRSGS